MALQGLRIATLLRVVAAWDVAAPFWPIHSLQRELEGFIRGEDRREADDDRFEALAGAQSEGSGNGDDDAATGAEGKHSDRLVVSTSRWNVNPSQRKRARHHRHHHRMRLVQTMSHRSAARSSLRQQSNASHVKGDSGDGGRTVLIVILTVVGIPAVSIALLTLLMLCNAAVYRSLNFFLFAVPIALVYKMRLRSLPPNQTDEERQKALQDLHQLYAPQVAEFVRKSKGWIIKFAQVLATQKAVPELYRNEFAKCHNSCVAMSFQEVKRVVESSLSRRLTDVYSSFDEIPLAAASIGQVHRARLRKEDVDVVVKVKISGVEGLFAVDYRVLKSFGAFISFLRLPVMDTLDTAVETVYGLVEQEFDYCNEVKNQDTMRKVLVPHFGNNVDVPQCYPSYCTRDVLTMEFIAGMKVDAVARESLRAMGLRLDGASGLLGGDAGGAGGGGGGAVARVNGRGASRGAGGPEEEGCLAKSSMGDATLTAALALLRTRAQVKRHCGTICSPCLPALRQGSGINEVAQFAANMDMRRAVDRMFEVWGYSILEAGTFNCDPHPGNILLQPNGRLGLIDYGQVSTLSLSFRKNFARVLLAVMSGDQAGCEQATSALGWTATWNKNVTPKPGTTPMWEWLRAALLGRTTLSKEATWSNQNAETILVTRVLIILKGLSICLGYPVVIGKMWQKHAERAIQLPDV